MLLGKDTEEQLLEILLCFIARARNRSCFAFARAGVLFDHELDVIIVNVV